MLNAFLYPGNTVITLNTFPNRITFIGRRQSASLLLTVNYRN